MVVNEKSAAFTALVERVAAELPGFGLEGGGYHQGMPRYDLELVAETGESLRLVDGDHLRNRSDHGKFFVAPSVPTMLRRLVIVPTPTIRISKTRTPKAIAADIRRRALTPLSQPVAAAQQALDAETDHRDTMRRDMHALAEALDTDVHRSDGDWLAVNVASLAIVAKGPRLGNDGGKVYAPRRGVVQIVTTLPVGPARAAEFGAVLRDFARRTSAHDDQAQVQG